MQVAQRIGTLSRQERATFALRLPCWLNVRVQPEEVRWVILLLEIRQVSIIRSERRANTFWRRVSNVVQINSAPRERFQGSVQTLHPGTRRVRLAHFLE